jgi:hypothetical protein
MKTKPAAILADMSRQAGLYTLIILSIPVLFMTLGVLSPDDLVGVIRVVGELAGVPPALTNGIESQTELLMAELSLL